VGRGGDGPRSVRANMYIGLPRLLQVQAFTKKYHVCTDSRQITVFALSATWPRWIYLSGTGKTTQLDTRNSFLRDYIKSLKKL
jgi:hypothetical protein